MRDELIILKTLTRQGVSCSDTQACRRLPANHSLITSKLQPRIYFFILTNHSVFPVLQKSLVADPFGTGHSSSSPI